MDTPTGDQNVEVLSSALGAFEVLARSDVMAAAERWNCPGTNAESASCNAHVISFANRGVGALLSRDALGARVNLERASNALLGCEHAVDGAGLRATSSGYHFRLAAHHASAFEQAHAARGAVLRDLMMTVIAHHDALLDGRARNRNKHLAMWTAVERVFGNNSIEARLCRAETLADIAACYAERSAKLRTIVRHWPARARLTPEVAVAALAIWPCEIIVEDTR